MWGQSALGLCCRISETTDLSFPKGRSVNDGISKVLASISYASVNEAVHYILNLGRSAQLVKTDLRNAYHIVPVHPQDQRLLAITWEGRTYMDRALPFGLRSAPKIFSAVADTIAWALHGAGIEHLIHYLDDFLLWELPIQMRWLEQRRLHFNTLGCRWQHTKRRGLPP